MAWVCEYPRHDGDRLVTYGQDQYVATIDFMSRDGNTRLGRRAGAGVKGGIRLCKTCATEWRGRLINGDAALDFDQRGLFG